MEVHHHPHVEKKNFKEYFLEFLMIFLAVTLGFVAENIRESLSDRSKEKEYISSIKKDLAADTSALDIWLPTLFQRVKDFDTLISLLQVKGVNPHGAELYYYARLSTRSRVFSANNNTIVELKNSGNFRLISNKKIIDGLTSFEKIIDSYINLSSVDNKESEMLYPLLGDLFDANIFNKMIKVDARGTAFSVDSVTASLALENLMRPEGNPQLRNSNADALNQLIFTLHERKSSFVGEIRLLLFQKKAAKDLIDLINKEYHL
ncbi:MAG TPA: hypothetical protein VK787_00840, partial [Puia sp.]|nr:hypothetical protein [Puia sp.]